jgi:hypothetical protein
MAAAGLLLGAPLSAAGRQDAGRPTSSHAPSGGGGGGGGASARPAPGGSGGGGSTGSQPAPRAVPRDSGGSTSGGSGTAGTASRPTSSRAPSSGTVVGHTGASNGSGGTVVVIPNGYYGGFYPWGYAGLGFGGYFAGYYGYYDPSLYGGYYAPTYIPSGYDEGTLRLKVKPRDGMVYVDGYYAGRVDEFDGVFQRLHIDPGPHHIQIRADGYDPLDVDIQIQGNRDMSYSGELKKTQ